QKHHALRYRHHDLIGVVCRQLGNLRADDASLRSRVVKIDRVSALQDLHVIDTTQEIVGMTVHRVHAAGFEDVRPAARDLVPASADLQKIKHAVDLDIDAPGS